jgi:hydroxymethylglutaryl-CoA reductase (NADPH)
MNLRGFKNAVSRRQALESKLKINLKNIGFPRNCENVIGVTQIPLGIAGPIKIGKRDYFIPLATTEGALVASVNRGCKAISLSGGCLSEAEKVGATRGPVFKIKTLNERIKLERFLGANFEKMKKIAAKTSPHLTLKDFGSVSFGKNFYIRFIFDTQDAMGMNMVTIATERISRFIEKKAKVKYLSISGNYCVDKKPSWLNFTQGRGFKVWSEVTLPKDILKKVLKTSARRLYDVWLSKCMLGSAASGSLGFNAQYANVMAAIFIATGQDPAHIVEGSLGITTAEPVGEDLYISVYLPDLMVGTVGGGTGLPTQKEALSILGVRKSGELAEAIGGATLAGEISLLASLAEGTLAKAHEALAGKNKP